MSRIDTCPDAKMTALGPVATGNMNAQLALIAAGIMSKRGSGGAGHAASYNFV